ncbi:TetR/AcrR family transcriptional regulator [Jiangella endophytica]|uniref:TetR/AcrR family transcriptional regulator n=1 Tax=Jiangella endophytica TaxID=1623398 RepID=UPI000E355A2F|nr:TetR/AcrR family transcriptional regulator [Jiangella endophytica]
MRCCALSSGIGKRRQAARSGGRESYEERRRKLIEAAAAVFQEKGYGAASLGDVANLLGSDRASLYYYVSSKEELFHSVVFHAAEENVRIAEEICASDIPSGEKLEQLIRALMLSYEKHYPYLYVYVQEKMSLFGPEEDRSVWASDMWELNRRYQDLVTGVVEEGIKEGVIKDVGRPRVIAYGIIGMVAWTHRWFRPEGQSTGEEVAEALAEIAMRGVLADRT